MREDHSRLFDVCFKGKLTPKSEYFSWWLGFECVHCFHFLLNSWLEGPSHIVRVNSSPCSAILVVSLRITSEFLIASFFALLHKVRFDRGNQAGVRTMAILFRQICHWPISLVGVKIHPFMTHCCCWITHGAFNNFANPSHKALWIYCFRQIGYLHLLSQCEIKT